MRMIHTLFITTAILTIFGCASTDLLGQSRILKNHPEWLTVKKSIQSEIKKNEGNSGWGTVLSSADNDALFVEGVRDGIWSVVAAADYPLNTLGRIIAIKAASSGEIISYSRKWEKNPQQSNREDRVGAGKFY